MKLRVWLAGLVFLASFGLMSCGPTPPASTAKAAQMSAGPRPLPRVPSLGLWPRPTKRASVFGTCRLPIAVPIEQTGRATEATGWMDVPTGSFQPDLASALDAIKESRANVPSPYTWDPAVEEWVPAPQKLISPDGRSYVRGDNVFNAKTGAIVHRIPFPNNDLTGVFYTIAYTGAAIYFTGGGFQPPPG